MAGWCPWRRRDGARPQPGVGADVPARTPRSRIAELVGGPASTVGYHLRLACAADPGLREAHEAAANAKPARVTAQGLALMQELVALVQETGCYPSRTADRTSERARAAWLQRLREEAWAGTLAQEYRDGLAVLDGWEGKPRAEADENRWQERLTALVEYRAAGNDWPRHKAVITGESTSWVSGCTSSGPKPALGNSIFRKPWTPPSPDGRVGGRAAGGPSANPDRERALSCLP